MIVQFRLRRAIAAEWATIDPVLEDGEPGWEQDTNRIKLGDGETRWNGLGYATYPATEYEQMIGDLTQDLTELDASVTKAADSAADRHHPGERRRRVRRGRLVQCSRRRSGRGACRGHRCHQRHPDGVVRQQPLLGDHCRADNHLPDPVGQGQQRSGGEQVAAPAEPSPLADVRRQQPPAERLLPDAGGRAGAVPARDRADRRDRLGGAAARRELRRLLPSPVRPAGHRLAAVRHRQDRAARRRTRGGQPADHQGPEHQQELHDLQPHHLGCPDQIHRRRQRSDLRVRAGQRRHASSTSTTSSSKRGGILLRGPFRGDIRVGNGCSILDTPHPAIQTEDTQRRPDHQLGVVGINVEKLYTNGCAGGFWMLSSTACIVTLRDSRFIANMDIPLKIDTIDMLVENVDFTGVTEIAGRVRRWPLHPGHRRHLRCLQRRHPRHPLRLGVRERAGAHRSRAHRPGSTS